MMMTYLISIELIMGSSQCVCVGGGVGGGYSDIFYIHIGLADFFGFEIFNFSIF